MFNFSQMSPGRPPMGSGMTPARAPVAQRPQAPSVPARPVGRPSTGPNTAAAEVMQQPRSAGWRRLAPAQAAPAAPGRAGKMGGNTYSLLGKGAMGPAGPNAAGHLAGAAQKFMGKFNRGGTLGGSVGMGAAAPAGGASWEAAPAGGGTWAAPAGGGGGLFGGMGAAAMKKMAAPTAAGALGGWNANPNLVKQATGYLKSGAELAPQHRASMAPLLRQTDQPMARRLPTGGVRPDLRALAAANPGSVYQEGTF